MNNVLRIKNGVMWSAIDKIAYSAGQLCLNLIIARLILPEEYALVAMITIFIAIGQTFIDSGFGQAIIQKQDRSELDLSTVFYFNIVVAIIIYCIIFVLSPLIADFYDNNIFIPLTRIVALNLIISSLSIVQRSILTIKVDFRTQAYISIISLIISGMISIWMAYSGYGVWAMVAQILIVHGISCLLLWIIVGWRPILKFSMKSFNILFSYGSKLLASRLLNTICQNIYTLAIGKVYAPVQVAFFNNANQLSMYSACYLNEIIGRTLFPIMCEMQTDKDKLLSFFYKTVRLSSYIIFPIMMGMIVLAKPFILTILSDKWIGMMKYMQIIAFAYMWYPLMGSNQLFTIIGRTDLYLKCEVIRKIVFAFTISSTLFLNVDFICLGIVVYNITEILIAVQMLKQIINISLKKLFINILPSLLFSMCMTMVIVVSTFSLPSEFLKLTVGVMIGIVSYYLLGVIFRSSSLSDIKKILKSKQIKE